MALGDYGLLTLRIVLGIIFLYHGYPKIKNPEMLMQVWGNKTIGLLQGLLEFVAGILILIGLLTQFASIFFIIIMLGAIYFKIFKWKTPFFAQNAMGWEFDLLILASSLALLFLGAGTYSLDFTLLP